MTMLLKVAICYLFFLASFVYTDDQTSASHKPGSDPQFDAKVSELLSKNVLQFAQEIGTTILQDSDKRTEVFSPLSIYVALSMLLMGSNGQTFQELMSLLKVNNDSYLMNNPWKIHEQFGLMIEDLVRDLPNPLHQRPHDYWQLNRRPMNHYGSFRKTDSDLRSCQRVYVANGIFVQNGYSIRPDYRQAIQSTYKSTLQRLDFLNKSDLSTEYINQWVNEKTEGKIKELFTSPIDASTKVVIASALYFNALWERTFFEGVTGPKDFFPDGHDNPSIRVDMMGNGGVFPFYESKEDDCRIIGLPYRHNLTTMFIILPNNSNRQRLRQLQATLTADKINNMISKMEWKTAIILLPKLHITNRLDLKAILNRMGLRSLFREDQSDLSLLSSGEQEFERISNIAQNHNSNPLSSVISNLTSPDRLLLDRLGQNGTDLNQTKRERRSAVTYKTSSSDFHSAKEPLRLKDLVIGKRITKSYPHKKHVSHGRNRRQIFDWSASLKRLDRLRSQLGLKNPSLFADELVHRVDLTVNEYGTEGGATTATTLRRSGPDVLFRTDSPFLFLIRHDDTRLPLFYGAVFEPTND